MNSVHCALTSITILVVLPSCTMDIYTAKATEQINVPYVPATAIEVNSRNGGIQVFGGDRQQGDIRIEASITAGGYTQEEADDRLAAVKIRCKRVENDRLLVQADFPADRRNRDGVSYVIHVPDVDGAKLKTSNGAIKVRAIGGRLEASSSNGRIHVEDHSGPVHARTSNGSVSLVDVAGPVDVATSNGPVDVRLRPESEGPLHVETSNGSVKLAVGARFRGQMGLGTSNGRVHFHNEAQAPIEARLEKRSGTLVFSGRGDESKVRSSNGSITVTVRN